MKDELIADMLAFLNAEPVEFFPPIDEGEVAPLAEALIEKGWTRG